MIIKTQTLMDRGMTEPQLQALLQANLLERMDDQRCRTTRPPSSFPVKYRDFWPGKRSRWIKRRS